MRRSRNALFALLIGAAILSPLHASAQPEPTLLILSQPDGMSGETGFVDLSPFLVREIEMGNKFQPVVFKRDLSAIRAALDAKTLTQTDVTPPFSRESIHKIADTLGANYALRVSAHSEKDGIFTKAEMEARAGQRAWNILFDEKLDPSRIKSKKAGILAGINAHVAALMSLITNIPTRITANPPATQPPPGKTPDTSPDLKNPPDNKGQAGVGAPDKTNNPPVQRAVNNGPSANELLVEQFRKQGDQANLIVSLRRAVNDRPRDARLRRDLIDAYNERGWHDVAKEEARRAVALAPEDASLHRLLGDSLLAGGETAEAIKAYAESVRLDSHSAVNLVALGDAYWNNAQPDEAQKTYAAAAQADDKNPLPHRRLARLYVQRGRLADCVAEMKAAQDLTPKGDEAGFRDDYITLLQFAEADMTDLLAKMQLLRKAGMDGTRTREEVFKDLQAQKKRAESVASFLEDLPKVPEINAIRADYAQAANLIAQADESAMQYLETQETSHREETDTYRFEAKNQIGTASKKLKSLTARKPPE